MTYAIFEISGIKQLDDSVVRFREWGMGNGEWVGNGVGMGSGITIITIYQILSVCRADNRDSIVLTLA